MEGEGNAFMWLRGDARERGLHPLNYQSLGMDPWIQQQMMPPTALHDHSGGDILKQQLLLYQQPFQFTQQSGITSPLLQQQQFIQQTDPQQIVSSQTHSASENHSVLNQQLQQPHNEQRKHVQEMQNFPQMFSFQNNYLQQQKSPVHSQLCQNLVFSDPGTNFSSVLTPERIQNISSSSLRDGSALNFPIVGQHMSEQNLQPWEPKLTMSHVAPFGGTVLLQPFSEKDGSVEADNCTADSQNHFGLNMDSSSLLSNGMPNLSANAFGTNVAAAPYAASCIQNSFYDYLDQSSGLGQHGEETDPATKTFVKVYKSGSVGRSLDISRFSSYEELGEELGQMFGVEGLLEDPLRSGWQLVFVDRENDVLLLGDDPWEAFVNNVWYIKILSPEDVQKMGKPGVDSFS